MLATDFVNEFAPQGLSRWEAAAFALCERGEFVRWPLARFACSSPDGSLVLTLKACTDYLAIGDQAAGDILRMSLTPGMAQKICDLWGMLLPTTRIARSVFAGSPNRVSPKPMSPNKGGNLQQYLAHSQAVDAQIVSAGFSPGLTSGQQKDIVVGNAMKPGAPRSGGLLIYGWPLRDAQVPLEDQPLMMDKAWRIQPYSPAHDAGYVDYSHGVRLVHPVAELPDGSEAELNELLRDPTYAKALSDEGPLVQGRYPYPGDRVTAAAGYPGQSFADRGLDVTRDRKLESLRGS